MQEHIRLLVERARRTEDRFTISGQQDSSTLLGEEVIRLAHLATSTHMLLWAKEAASNNAHAANSPEIDAQLHQTITRQEQSS